MPRVSHNLPYTPDELMTVAAARSVGNDDVCFVGIGLPSAACNLARLTHAPGITLIYESGTIGPSHPCCRCRSATANCADRADHGLGAGVLPLLAAERPDHRRLPGRRTDPSLRATSTPPWSAPYASPAVRLPGGGGAPDMAAACQRIFIVMPQSPAGVRRPVSISYLVRPR